MKFLDTVTVWRILEYGLKSITDYLHVFSDPVFIKNSQSIEMHKKSHFSWESFVAPEKQNIFQGDDLSSHCQPHSQKYTN